MRTAQPDDDYHHHLGIALTPAMHKVLEKQLARARLPSGDLDIAELCALVSEMYETSDRNRERTERSIALMVEELEERHRDLIAREAEMSLQNQHFKDALASMGSGLTMYGADRRLIVCNDKYIHMYGLDALDPRPGLPYDTIRAFYNESGLFVAPVDAMTDLPMPRGAQRHVHETRDGRSIAVTRIGLESGGWVALHDDVTEQVRLTALREAAEREARLLREQELRAESESKAKSDFLAMMSHEIRTPLNAVLGLATTLLETRLDQGQRRAVEAIDQSGGNLLRLLNDILDFSKLDAGRMEFETIVFSPGALIENTLSIAGIRAAEKSLTLRAEIDPALPRALQGDPGRIGQVLLNLATNAVKFTDAGEVVIGVRPLGDDPRCPTIEFHVRDTGVGVPADRIPRLFGAYAQADSSVARQFGGTGLGLAICKRIVEQLGGDIGVVSREGEGSTFSFRLALPIGPEAALAERVDPRTPDDPIHLLGCLERPLRLLVAEDNPTNQMVVRKMLDDLPISLLVAGNGHEAVECARRIPPDMIFMDMRMPEMDGLAATRALRALGGDYARVPIIALTANAFPDDIRACREAGMNDFIAKPVRKRTLTAAIARVVSAMLDDSVAPTASDAADRSSALEDDAPLVDRDALAELAEEIGPDGAGQTLAIYFEETRGRLARLDKLRRDEDRAALRAEAHTLKGASGTFGFRLLEKLAGRLERAAQDIGADERAAAVAELEAVFARVADDLAARPPFTRAAA